MIKKITTVTTALFVLAALFLAAPCTAALAESIKAAQGTVSYIDENGTNHDLASGAYSLLTSANDDLTIGTSGKKTFYVADGSITIDGQLAVQGTVGIILCDGCTLSCKEGLIVPQNNTVDIYCQTGKTGKLEAKGNDSAGIGGEEGGIGIVTVGTINIHGGNISAAGDDYSAGIGAGDESYNTATVNILGGTVVAQGGTEAAGIGGGDKKTGGHITISGGDVTATGGQYAAGIGAGDEEDGGVIVITGGTVTAQGGIEAAGIGGGRCSSFGGNGGYITINGGTITATGGKAGAGIGGGNGEKGTGGEITITGGIVTATGGDFIDNEGGGAGIGGGDDAAGGKITISGGTITATGGTGATLAGAGAGIGGGDNGEGGIITISDGDIMTHGGKGTWGSDGGAGIGGGNNGNGGTITISGGNIEAYGGRCSIDPSSYFDYGAGGAGIGGGEGGNGGTITISGGTIYAEGGYGDMRGVTGGGAGIGGGDDADGGDITISLTGDAAILAYGGWETSAAAIGAGDGGNTVNLKLDDQAEAFEITDGTDGDIYIPVAKDKRLAECKEIRVKLTACLHEKILRYIDLGEAGHQRICRYCYVEKADTNNPQPHVPGDDGICTLCGEHEGEAVPYLDENREQQVCTEYKVLDQSDVDAGLSEGWYYVTDLVNTYNKRIVVNGDVKIIIRNGSELKAVQGFEVRSGSSLTVYGQDGEGYLIATGTSGNAGIGGNGSAKCGTISINGVNAEVTGGEGAAAVGAGKGGTYGLLVINYATVTATGGDGGAGIGGGQCDSEHAGNDGAIKIMESKITAQGGAGGAGIGGGYHQSGGDIYIDGSQVGDIPEDPVYLIKDMIDDPDFVMVKATGGKDKDNGGGGAGIGGGEDGDGNYIKISGGNIWAIGGECNSNLGSGGGAGIGGGDEGNSGVIVIEGGLVFSEGGNQTAYFTLNRGGGAGIGGGNNGSGETINIYGGVVLADGGYAKTMTGGGAGIGGGDDGDSGVISIYDGVVIAEAHPEAGSNAPAGIGSGYGGDFNKLLILGGYVDAASLKGYAMGYYGESNKGDITIGDSMSVYYRVSGPLSDWAYSEWNKRVSACHSLGEVIVAKCIHPDADCLIAEPANTGHIINCNYCNTYHGGKLDEHELNDDAVCMCGYHGVILTFDAGEAGSDAGTMDNVVLLGNTAYELPKCGFVVPNHYEFAGWLVGDDTYTAGDTITTPETLDETATITIVAQWCWVDHDWAEPTYAWSDDFDACAAERVCTIDASHKETEEATVTSVITKEATETEKGEIVYTAEFTNPAFETQTKVAEYDYVPPVNPGWNEIDGAWYYYNEDGTPVIGWKKIDGKWYYFDDDSGAMTTGWRQISSKWYYFSGYGNPVVGWKQINGTWYYFDTSTAVVTVGWKQIGGKWYYFDTSTAVVTVGWKQIGGKWYYFDTSTAVMATGWKQIGDKWYYFNSNGNPLTGWQQIGGTWYYFDTSTAALVIN